MPSQPERRKPSAPDQRARRSTPTKPPDQGPDSFDLWTSRAIRWIGVAIAVYETVVANTDRPGVLALAGAMMSGSLIADVVIKRRRG